MLMLIAAWAVLTLVCTLGALLLLALDERQVTARTLVPASTAVPALVAAPAVAAAPAPLVAVAVPA